MYDTLLLDLFSTKMLSDTSLPSSGLTVAGINLWMEPCTSLIYLQRFLRQTLCFLTAFVETGVVVGQINCLHHMKQKYSCKLYKNDETLTIFRGVVVPAANYSLSVTLYS